MWCTTECWDCHDTKCEHFISQVDKDRKELRQIRMENIQLKERIAYLERSNNRREDEIISLREELGDSEDCREKAIQYIKDCQLGVDGMDRPYMLLDQEEGKELLAILERLNK